MQIVLQMRSKSPAHLESDMSERLPQLVVRVTVVGVQVGAHSSAEENRVLGDRCTRASRNGFSSFLALGGKAVR